MKTGLTDRYVAAVVRAVPIAQRQDVGAELRASIADAIDGLTAAGVPHAAAEEQVLAGLGEPHRLAAGYGSRTGYLIGPEQYPDYIRLLRALELLVPPIVGLVTLFAMALDGAGVLEILFTGLWAMFMVGVQIAFWVTVVFAILERTGNAPEPEHEWSVHDLPDVPAERFGIGESVWTIALMTWMIFAIAWQRTHWLITTQSGEEVPVLNPELWSFWLPALILVLVATIVLEAVKYRVGRWTTGLAIASTALNVAFAAIVVGLWIGPGLLNPAVAAELPAEAMRWLDLIPWAVVVICAWETIEAWRRVRRQSSEAPAQN